MIRKKMLLSLFFILLLAIPVSAEEPERINWTESDFEFIHENIEPSELQDEINSNQEEIPDFVENIVGNQRINVYFQETNATYSALMNGTTIETLNTDELDNATLQVNVNETSLDAIIESEQTLDELRKQLDKGEIEYEALNTSNRVRFFITERILDLFSGLNIL